MIGKPGERGGGVDLEFPGQAKAKKRGVLVFGKRLCARQIQFAAFPVAGQIGVNPPHLATIKAASYRRERYVVARLGMTVNRNLPLPLGGKRVPKRRERRPLQTLSRPFGAPSPAPSGHPLPQVGEGNGGQ